MGEILARLDTPYLTDFGNEDAVTRGGGRLYVERVPGAAGQPHIVTPAARHFLQEDAQRPCAT